MKKIFIYFISGITIAIIYFFIYKLISFLLQKEREMTEELIKMDNGKELINKRIKHNIKRTIIMTICFLFCLSIILFIIILIILFVKKNISLVYL